MHTSRTPGNRLLTKRIDPDYYAPQHIEDEEALNAVGAITLGSTGKLFAGPFGSKLPTSVFVKDGVPLFRVGNVGAMEVDSQNLAMISQDLHGEISASEVMPGDVLIVKASVGEKVCVLPETIERANITQHIIGLRPNGTVDERFIAAVLFSSYGRRQMKRRALGAIIQYLGIVEARTVLLPEVNSDAQVYIGNKVRQAEALRAAAHCARDEALARIAELFGGIPADMNSELGAVQFARYVSGAVQAGINLEDLREIRVPLAPEDAQRSIGKSARNYIEAFRNAKRLTHAARMLVEALIERKVTEADLVAAHKSPPADRALLERMTLAGLDAIDTAPLFPDLDRLQELLAQSPPDTRGAS